MAIISYVDDRLSSRAWKVDRPIAVLRTIGDYLSMSIPGDVLIIHGGQSDATIEAGSGRALLVEALFRICGKGGRVVIFSGGQQWEDHQLLWDRLDAIHARIPAMVLATTAQNKGCDAIAAAWAARSGVKLVAFTLDARLGKRAGFARNERLLALRPVEALVCEGSGLQSHLARMVREKRVPAHFFRLSDQRTASAVA